MDGIVVVGGGLKYTVGLPVCSRSSFVNRGEDFGSL
jgi:hypothetical protein